MNILFIHEVDWVSKVVTDFHLLAEGLALRGHKVYVIDYEDRWKRSGFFDFGSLKTREINGVSRAFPEASVDVRRPGFIKIPGLSRMSAYLTHSREIEKTIREKRIDAVVLYSVPTNGLQTLRKARKLGVPVFFRSIDILNQLVRYPALRPATRFFERKVYPGADLILALTPSITRYVCDMGADMDKVRLLRIPIDTTLFHPFDDVAEMRRKWNLGERDKVILFMGTLFEFSGLDVLLSQLPDILKNVPEARLLIVGDGPQRPKLERLIAGLSLEKVVTITGFQPYVTMPQYINLATLCVNPFLLTGATNDIFPGKIAQYLSCGKAVVATPLPGMKAVTPGEEQGVLYSRGMDDLKDKIILLLKSADHRERLGRQGLAYARKNHDYTAIAREVESILETALRRK